MDLLVSQTKLSLEELFKSLSSSLSGLPEKEVEKRLTIYGTNQLIEKRHFVVLKLLWESFFSPLILLLLIASFISSLLGDVKDFIVIFSIVLLSGLITFYQHFKADHAAEKLKKKVQLEATVIRNGIRKEIPFGRIVPGDIILLTAGDIIPADGRIIEVKDFSVDESTLTGESFPAQKTLALNGKTATTLSSLTNIIFAGTHVVSGEATALVLATGTKTQLGQLSKEIVKAKPQTDFDAGIQHLSVLMIKLIIILCFFVFGINAALHHELLASFTFAVALAVGLTPELMPVILTINLSRGALRMEKKEVIVKYLPAIQNFGSMDILCTDKTGTLTENNITLRDYQDISGKKLQDLLLFSLLDASLKSAIKDPLDHAILRYDHNLSLHEYKKIDEIPFDFKRKRASVVVENNKKQFILITKGAPQKVLPLCTLSSTIQKHITEKIDNLNKEGYRVLVVATKKVTQKRSYEETDEHKLTFLGILIFQDTVKVTAATTIKNLEKLGINVKILTGDNEVVTEKVCTDVHLPILGIVTGEEIDKYSNEQLQQAVEKNTIFARLTPQQKERIIEALKKNNHVVGYLGDGVNDAPPLKASDVGISVNNGSDIARDVADIVLMRKNLSILQEGVMEGRKTHSNISKYIFMSLSSNLGNMISIALASLFLPFLPLLPIQVLLINFLYDTSQITIPTDNVDIEQIKQPQHWNMKFIKKFMLFFGPISSFFDICTFLGLLYIFHANVTVFRTGWFLESVVTQTIIIFLIRTRRIPFIKSLPSLPVFISAVITILVGFLFIATPFANTFGFTRIPATFYIFLGVIIVAYCTAVESGKLLFYTHMQRS